VKALVLVDLDNFMPHPRAPLPSPAELPFEGGWSARGPQGDELAVVFAMNTATAQRLDLAWLQGLSRRLHGEFASAGPLGPIEVGLVLVMPETADDLLLRLLREAGHPHNVGKFGRVWLVSRDKGLRTRVAKTLGAPQPDGRGDFVRIAAPFERSFRPPPERAAAIAKAPSQPLSRPLEDDPSCVWAHHQIVQGSGSLADLAARIELEPWLATQLGPTRTSLDGIFRLVQLLDGCLPTLNCRAGDGVEVVTVDPDDDWMPPRFPDEIISCSLGPGAWVATWRQEDVRAMLRSRLPWWLAAELTDAQQAIPLGLAAVVDDLVALSRPRVLGVVGPRVQVRLSKRGGARGETRIAAEMEAPGDVWWWVPIDGEQRCTRKVSVSTSPYNPLEIELVEPLDAQLARVRHRGGPLLVSVSATDPGVFVVPRRRIPANQIGLAFSDKQVRCGLLALGAPVVDEVEVVPIQHVRVPVLRAASQQVFGEEQLEALRHLPLVVPVRALFAVS
jgi:hypothetical protein